MREQASAGLRRSVARSVRDERVLDAIAAVPREVFVHPAHRAHAYEDRALPIAEGQTISQPTVVARMCELLELRPDDRVLDVGTGSGYHAAVLARLCAHVWSIERHAALSASAAARLRTAGVGNVTLLVGDGTAGHPAEAPFDAINVAAAAWGTVPPALERQLTDGGRLVIPVAKRRERLVLARRHGDLIEETALDPVSFVPLVPGVP